MSGFEKQTYTQVPNSLFRVMSDMDECELKVVLYICRHTFGYHRDEIKISTRKLAKAINMSVASVDKGADAAVRRGLVERITDGQNTTLWRALVSDSEIESPESDSENETDVIQKVNRVDSENESQVGVKERLKKEIKEREAPALNFKSMTVPQARKLATLKLYAEAADFFPGSIIWEYVHNTITEHALTFEKIHVAAVEWSGRGYKQENVKGILEWAVHGIPAGKNAQQAPIQRDPMDKFAALIEYSDKQEAGQ